VPADVHNPPGVAENFQQGAVPFHHARLTTDEQLQRSITRAAGIPPPTGASRTSTPCFTARSWTGRAAAGELLVMSIQAAPAASDFSAPSSPSIATRTSRAPGSMVISTPAAEAA
jgi:hypothetical protein